MIPKQRYDNQSVGKLRMTLRKPAKATPKRTRSYMTGRPYNPPTIADPPSPMPKKRKLK